MAQFQAGLCKMVNGNLADPYEGMTIETNSTPDAIEKAKRWARSVVVPRTDDVWLQILWEGKCMASLKPGE